VLEIHVINVQQGDATFIIGPNGTTVLIDGGNTGKGTDDVVPYLEGLGHVPGKGLDYMIASHRDADHIGGMDEVIQAGYDVRKNIWDNGSTATGTVAIRQFLEVATTTTAGAVQTMPLGQIVDLGDGAKITAVAVGGQVIGQPKPSSPLDENDMSVALLVQYNGFDYITAGDLGGGNDGDAGCTGRTTTSQENIESLLAWALIPKGGGGLLTQNGVEVLHVNHHGSESSTNHEWMNRLSPAVALIQVGSGGGGFEHPRKAVVENVLLAHSICVTAAPALVLQTDEGGAATSTNTSTAGYVVGDIVIKTTGQGTFDVSGSGRKRNESPDERIVAGVHPNAPRQIPFDK